MLLQDMSIETGQYLYNTSDAISNITQTIATCKPLACDTIDLEMIYSCYHSMWDNELSFIVFCLCENS